MNATTQQMSTYHRAMERLDDGRLDEALELLREHLLREPGDAEALNDAGVILYRLGAFDEAISHLRRALDRAPEEDADQVAVNLADALLGAGRPREVVELAENHPLEPECSAALLNRAASALLHENDFAAAYDVLMRSLRVMPQQPPLLGLLQQVRGIQPMEAESSDPAEQMLRGAETLCADGDWSAAAGLYQGLLRRYPHRKRIRAKVAEGLCRAQQRDEAALALCRRINELEPNVETLLLEARIHQAHDRMDRAVELLECAKRLIRETA